MEGRIEFCVAIREPRPAFIRELLIIKSRVGEESEALEYGSIAEFLSVAYQ